MLERARIIRRSETTGRLEGVFFCERDEQAFGQIAELIGSPEQGFLGEFEKIVLFEDDEDTRGRSIEDDEPYDESVRKKLRYKDAHHRLRQSFPFDIINLDVYGNMFPPNKGVIARLLRSIIRILEWQTTSTFPNGRQCERFTLFLTCYINPDRTDEEAVRQLTNRLNENIDNNDDFRTAFRGRYGHQEAGRLASENFAEFFSLSLPKYMAHLSTFRLGWSVRHGPTYLYNRPDPHGTDEQYQMLHAVSVYERIPDFGGRLDEPSAGLYATTVSEIINKGVEWIERLIEEEGVRDEIAKDLADIVQSAEQSRAH